MKNLLLLSAALSLTNTALATESTLNYDAQLKLSNVVVTPSRIAETDTPTSSVTVFTRSDIERLRPGNVLELLTHVPGVQVATYGGKGATYSLYIRGTSTAQSLVLIDGVRVGSATAGGASLQHLSVEQIERIEVLRGSRSGIYGSDAIGGVVQIFTRRPEGEDLTPNIRIAAGSFDTLESSLGLSGGNKTTRFNIQTAYETTNGFDRTEASWPSNEDNDGYRNRSFSANISHRISEYHEAGISALDQRGKTEYDNPSGSGWPAKDANPYDKFTVSSVSAYLNSEISDIWNSRFEIGHSEDKIKNYDYLSADTSKFNTYRDSVQWFNTLTITKNSNILLGIDYLNDQISTLDNMSTTSRWNKGAVAQYRFNNRKFIAELGGRYDHNEQFGEELTYNGSVGVSINEKHRLLAVYSEAFRAPSFNDLYWPGSESPSLRPETSDTYEIKWQSEFNDLVKLDASLYRTDINDMIAWAPTAPGSFTWLPANINSVRIKGAEANLAYTSSDWLANLGVSIIDPVDRISDKQLINRATQTITLDLDRQLGNFGIGTSITGVNHSYADQANTQRLAGYGVLDLRANWQATRTVNIDLKLTNVLDKDYKRISYSYGGANYGYRETPFTIMAGLTWRPSF